MTTPIDPDNIEVSVFRWERTNPEIDCEVLAKQMVAELPAPALAPIVTRLLEERLNDHRRRRARDAEARAEMNRRTEERARLNEHADEVYTERPWDAPSGTRLYRQWKRLSPKEQVRQRSGSDPKFARFVAETSDGELSEADFADWKVEEAFERFRQDTRLRVVLELTGDLLEAEFALGDGSVVTWGDATVAQHQQRFDMLMANASGSLHSAQRHAAAVKMLAEHGAATLAEVGK